MKCDPATNVHLWGPTNSCLMCYAPRLCEDCGKAHGYSQSVKAEVARFLTNRRESRGLLTVTHYKEHIVDVMNVMVLFILEGGPEKPPTREEISCYFDRWVDYVKRENGIGDSSGDAVESEA